MRFPFWRPHRRAAVEAATTQPLPIAEPLEPVSVNPEPIQPDIPMTTQSDALMDGLNRLGGSFKTRLDEANAIVDGMAYGKGEDAFNDDIAKLRAALDNISHHVDAMVSTASAVATISPAAALSGVDVTMTEPAHVGGRRRR